MGQSEAPDRRQPVANTDPVVLDLYKVAVEMADRVSSRRGSANGFFLAVQSALVGLASVSLDHSWAVSTAGIAVSFAWWLQLRSYRDLNQAKFNVILEIESQLPIQIFGEEWETLKSDRVKKWRKRYAELGFSERTVPVVFAAIYVTLLVT